ncbi:MAG TPA: AI-2E family transporter [Methanomicrobiales archaeon]|jgi:predicted PurR-regulated permease PerM|nr:AI-2E family transporter [Methanomicrobiales archaeon]
MEPGGRGRTLLIAALLAGVAVLALLWPWADTVPLGIAVAVVLAPLQHRLGRRIPGWLSALAITLILLLVAIAGISFTVTVMQENLATNGEILMGAANGVELFASRFTALGIPQDTIGDAMGVIRAVIGGVGSFWSGITLLSVIGNERLILFLAALFLSLWLGDRVLRRLLVRIPADWMEYYHRLATVSVDTLYSVLVVHLIMVTFTFALSIPFFWVLGYGHVLYLSTATALCELVPVLGASVPMAILLFYTFALGDLRGFLLVFFVGVVMVALLPELTLRPILMGRRACLSPVIMFFGFMGGILILGITGFLLGPLALAVAVSWLGLRKEKITAKAP